MSDTTRITQLLSSYIEASIALADQSPVYIYQLGQMLIESLLADGKILVCTDGPSYANGMHFEAMMLHRHGAERPPLPVMRLGQTSGMLQGLETSQPTQLYVRDIQALGHARDVLVILGVSPTRAGLSHALKVARDKGMRVGYIGGCEPDFPLESQDVCVSIPVTDVARTLALQLLVLHGISEVVDQGLFAGG